ncbi:hypothetical protein, partial [Streptomyces sp. NPDC002343]
MLIRLPTIGEDMPPRRHSAEPRSPPASVRRRRPAGTRQGSCGGGRPVSGGDLRRGSTAGRPAGCDGRPFVLAAEALVGEGRPDDVLVRRSAEASRRTG